MFFRSRGLLAVTLLTCSCLAAEIRTLTILHTNDLHSRLSPLDTQRGGFAYLATVIRRERAGCMDCILLNAGDLAQGTPVSTIFHGLPVFEIANLFGFDAATLGNHDFDYGWARTRKFLTTAKYPIVSANVVDPRGRTLTTDPFVILKVNGLRVAVIGVMTDDLKILSFPKLLGDWQTVSSVETARKYADKVKAKSDLIVLLGHITGEEENRLLDTAPEIPVLVTGHIHTGLAEAKTRDGRVLVRVKSYGEELGRLELKVDTEKKAPVSWTWKHIVVDSPTLEPASDVARLVKRWEGQVSSRVDKPLAVSKRRLSRLEVKSLVEQAMREETGSDFAFMNAGGVRDIVPQGPLQVRNVWDIMPFDNRLVIGRFKGRDLPAVVVGDRPIDPDREYTLAVSDFTAANQGTAENLKSTGLQFPEDAGLLRDVLLEWFRKKKVIEN